MADEKRKVSLVITAKDQASAVIKGTSAVIRGIASKIWGSFTALNQGLELAKKLIGALGSAFSATIGKALEFRSYWDGAQTDIRSFGKAIEQLQVAIGDALLPVVQTFTQALMPVIALLTAWLRANREVIALKVSEALLAIASALNTALNPALKAAAVFVRLFVFQFKVLHAVGGAIVQSIIDGFKEMGGLISSLAQAAGLDKLAEKFGKAAAAVGDELGGAFDGVAKKAREVWDDSAFGELERDLRGDFATIEGLSTAIDNGLSKVAVRAAANAGRAIAKFSAEAKARILGLWTDNAAKAEASMARAALAAELAQARLERIAEVEGKFQDDRDRRADRSFARQVELADRLYTHEQKAAELSRLAVVASEAAKLAEREGNIERARQLEEQAADLSVKATDESTARIREALESIAGLGDQILGGVQSALSGFFQAAVKGSEDVGSLISKLFENIGEAIVNALIEKLIVSGIVGLLSTLLGGFLGDVAFAVGDLLGIQSGGIIGGTPKLAGGGLVRMADGGTMFRGSGYSDSIHALVSPGELVTPYRDVQRNLAEGRAPGDSGAPRRGEGSATTINVAVQSFVPPSRAQLDHAVHQGLEPSLRSNIRAGRLRLRPA